MTEMVISLESSVGVASLGSSVIIPADRRLPGRDESNVGSEMKLALIEHSFQSISYDALAKLDRKITGNEGAMSVLGKRWRFIPCGSRSYGSSFQVSIAKRRGSFSTWSEIRASDAIRGKAPSISESPISPRPVEQ